MNTQAKTQLGGHRLCTPTSIFTYGRLALEVLLKICVKTLKSKPMPRVSPALTWVTVDKVGALLLPTGSKTVVSDCELGRPVWCAVATPTYKSSPFTGSKSGPKKVFPREVTDVAARSAGTML